jgi:glycosyltransferase involved in cell wall biosynthesis
VSGGAARLVPPGDDRQLAAAIRSVWNDPAERAALRARGLVRARAFHWRKTAAELLDVFAEISRPPGSAAGSAQRPR